MALSSFGGWRRFMAACTAALLVGACSAGEGGAAGDPDEPLLVMAPSSMSGAMTAIVEAFEAGENTEVDLVLGATGNLASQLENGAPVDVFFSADEATVDRLIASGRLRSASRRLYAQGRLVLVTAPGFADPPASLTDLREERFSLIAIANPELAPYGAAARQALESTGVLSSVQRRIVMGDNIAQTYQFVATGNADVALVARSVVVEAGENLDLLEVDPSLHSPILHAAAVVEESTHPLAGRFLEYVTGEEGVAILTRFGFSAPPADQG